MHLPTSRRISGLDNLSATLTHCRQDKTLHRAASSELLICADSGDLFRIRLDEYQDEPFFVDKLISAFRFNPAWREHFRVFESPHLTAELHYTNGRVGQVDRALQPYVQRLNDQGYATLSSCEGDPHPMGRLPSITFADAMPEDLHAIWARLSWVNLDGSVSPIPCHGYSHTYRQLFLLVLDDWLNDDLDHSAVRYQLKRTALPLIPALPSVNAKALADHQAIVTRRVKRLNKLGDKATFDDLVKLRCGRDRYSLWKIDQLRGALSNDPALEQLPARIHDIPALQRALRWRLRGLDLVMILKKHEVDQVLEARKLARSQAAKAAAQKNA
jgi:hypothetical protein